MQYQKEGEAAITADDNITVSCPIMSHGLIDDVSVSETFVQEPNRIFYNHIKSYRMVSYLYTS